MLSAALVSRIDERIERTVPLAGFVPAEQLRSRPPIPGAWPAGEFPGHLLDCLAEFRAVLYAV
jgi:hypothetical protein